MNTDVIQTNPALSTVSKTGLIYKIHLIFKLGSPKIRFLIFESTELLFKKMIDSQISDTNCHWLETERQGQLFFRILFFSGQMEKA